MVFCIFSFKKKKLLVVFGGGSFPCVVFLLKIVVFGWFFWMFCFFEVAFNGFSGFSLFFLPFDLFLVFYSSGFLKNNGSKAI